MMNKINTFIFLAFSILLACSAKDSGGNVEQESDSQNIQEESRTIVDAKFETIDGQEFTLNDFKGKTVVLNLWATWCKPCIYEMPSISRASESFGDEVVFLAASDEKMERVVAFNEKYPDFNFQIIRVKEDVLNFGVQALPTTFLINKEGEIAQTEVGGREWDSPKQLELIKSI